MRSLVASSSASRPSRLRRSAALALAGACVATSVFAVGCHKTSASPRASAAVTEDDQAPLFPLADMIARAAARPVSAWPSGGRDWDTASADEQAANVDRTRNAACGEFTDFLFPTLTAEQKAAQADLPEEQQALRTDGALVVQGGRIVWEHYAAPYDATKRHCVWSASKSITTGIIAAIAQSSAEAAKAKADGQPFDAKLLTRSGAAITLATPLSDLLDDVAAINPDPRLASMSLEDFLSMNIPNPAWNEGYDGNLVTSSVVHMLWTSGAKDMGSFAANALMKPEAGDSHFKYSSGNAVVLMRALKDRFGAAYDRMPWDMLFDRLGMASAVFERDQQGTFVGSSYAHMSLRDMARFGYAYLNGGAWRAADGMHQVLHPDFVQGARELGAGMRSVATPDDDITEEGSFYSLGFWINPNPLVLSQNLAAKGITRTFGANFPQTLDDPESGTKGNGLLPGSKFFPNSPVDVIFAAGHYGQNILIFPKEDLMVVRMSHDSEYFSKLDKMMSSSRACFLGAR